MEQKEGNLSYPTIFLMHSNRQMQLRANERDQELRNDWILNKLTKYKPEQFVFVDESAANEHSAHRKRGWTPIGQVANQTTPLKHSER